MTFVELGQDRWFMVVRHWRVRYARAEAPCWKGEIQIGPLVYAWAREGE